MSRSANADEVGLSRAPGQALALGRVLERAVTTISKKVVTEQTGDEKVGVPVVVVITDGDTLAITSPPGEALDPGLPRDIAKRPVPLVAKEPVARLGDCSRASAWGRRERAPLHTVDIEPAIPVEVNEAHATRKALGQKAVGGRGPAVVKDEAKSTGVGIIDEMRPRVRRPG